MKNKLLPSLEEAIRQSGLRDGMTISFHHHFREGDLLMNQVMTLIDRMGFRDLTVSASSFFNAQASVMMDLIRRGVVTGLECNYMAGGFGKEISRGILKKPVIFRSHGGRDAALWTGECHIDVAFIGAPSADPMGNMSAATGPAACGTLGYAGMDAVKADKVIAITDSASNSMAKAADYVLLAKSDMASFVDSLVAPLSLINALLVAIARSKSDVVDHFERLENIWEEYGVFVSMEEENQ